MLNDILCRRVEAADVQYLRRHLLAVMPLVGLRQALAELEKDGIIKKSRGCGAKICEKPAPFVHKMDFLRSIENCTG